MVEYILHTLIIVNFWIPAVMGYNLLFGRGKLFHFGPLGTWVATAYAIIITLMSTQNALLALAAGIVVSLVISSVFAWLSLRLEPDGLGVMTIAMHLTLIAVVLNWTDLTRGALGIPGIPRLPFMSSTISFAIVTTVISVLWIALFIQIHNSRFGRQVEALADNEIFAKSMGVSRENIHFWAYILLGLSTVIPAFFAPQYLHILHPNDYLFPAFIFLVMIVVAGKPGSIWGGILSTIVLVILRELLRFVPMAPGLVGPVRLILFGLILFIAVWIRRDTVFPRERKV